jgi:hypothetical protein
MTADFALAMSVLATLGFSAFGVWQFAVTARPSSFAAASLALGMGLAVLVASTFLVYAIPFGKPARELGVNLVLPLIAFAGVLFYAGKWRQVKLGGLLFFGAAAFFGLWYLGFYAGLLVACAFGDCI